MKKIVLILSILFVCISVQTQEISKEATNIVKLTNAGLDKSVIQSYVFHIHLNKPISIDDLIYLNQNKVSSDVIISLMSTPIPIDREEIIKMNILDYRRRIMFSKFYK